MIFLSLFLVTGSIFAVPEIKKPQDVILHELSSDVKKYKDHLASLSANENLTFNDWDSLRHTGLRLNQRAIKLYKVATIQNIKDDSFRLSEEAASLYTSFSMKKLGMIYIGTHTLS